MTTISFEGMLRFPAASSPRARSRFPSGASGTAAIRKGPPVPGPSATLDPSRRTFTVVCGRDPSPLTGARGATTTGQSGCVEAQDVDDGVGGGARGALVPVPVHRGHRVLVGARVEAGVRRAAARPDLRRSARRRGTRGTRRGRLASTGVHASATSGPSTRATRPVGAGGAVVSPYVTVMLAGSGSVFPARSVATARSSWAPAGSSSPPAGRGSSVVSQGGAERTSPKARASPGRRRTRRSNRTRGHVEVRRLGHDAHRVAEAGPVGGCTTRARGARLSSDWQISFDGIGLVPGPVHGDDAVAVLAVGERAVVVGGPGDQDSPSCRRPRWRSSWRGARCGRRGCRRRPPKGSAARTGRASRRAPGPSRPRPGPAARAAACPRRRGASRAPRCRSCPPPRAPGRRARPRARATRRAARRPPAPTSAAGASRRRGSRPLRRRAGTPRSRRRCAPCRARRARPPPARRPPGTRTRRGEA